RELNVAQVNVQNIIGLQAGIGVTSPIFGLLAERYGRKRVMMGSLLMMSAAAGVGWLLPNIAVFIVMMLLFGVGKIIFDPAMGGYIGDRVPYHKRGMAFGVMELAWAGSLIIASLGVGWLLDVSTLKTVFGALSAGLLISAGIVFFGTPADHTPKTSSSSIQAINLKTGLRLVLGNRRARACLGYSLLVAIANEIIFINYGQFMESTFDLKLTALGLATTVIAAAEVSGEVLVIGAADRFGKRRLALIAAGVASVMYLILPMLTSSLPLALIGLFVMFFAVETSIVAAIPIYSEVLPEARSVMFSVTMGAGSIGRLIGSLIGGLLYGATGSFALLGIVSMTIGLISVGLFWRFIHEQPQSVL
ncbi:MAG: MFS transporter, partial [Anaerolineae bacterium]|nr:MFS transporter [Anaerolineae bacterium]